MKNLNFTQILLALVLISNSLFVVGCSDDNGSSRSSTTACPNNPYYNSYEDQWYHSYDNLTICNPLPAAVNQNCNNGEVIVRSPYAYNDQYYNQNNNYYNQNNNYYNSGYPNSTQNNINYNYHVNPNSYQEICMAPGGASWNYVINTGGYYYVNYNALNTAYVNYNAYYPLYLTPMETLLAFGVLAVLFQ